MSDKNGQRSSIEKLKGRQNFDTWKVAAKSYLIIKDLWDVIEKEIPPEESPQTNARAISEITLLIEQSLYNYIEDSEQASVVWNGLLKAFDDRGVARKVTILNLLVSVRLNDHKNMEKYINTILLYWNKSKVAGFRIDEDVVASLMLGGLPDEYRAMILGIENSGQDLTVDYVKTVLLQGIIDPLEKDNENKAMQAQCSTGQCNLKKKSKRHGNRQVACFKCKGPHLLTNCPKRELKCYECSSIKHLLSSCPIKRKKKIKKPIKEEEETKAAAEPKSMIAFFTNGGETIKNDWYIDSGATIHICNNRELFDELNENELNREILVANNNKVKVRGLGSVKLNIGDETIVLKKVNYVPEMCTNLISVRRITESGYQVLFTQGRCQVIDKKKIVLMEARLLAGMYRVKVKPAVERVCLVKTIGLEKVVNSSVEWHRKFGHPGYGSLKLLENELGEIQEPKEKCKICVMGKQTRSSYKSIGKRSDELLNLIHTDVNGPLPTESLGGHRYFITFIDDFSKKVTLYPLKLKSEVFSKMVEYKNLVENQLGKKIKNVRSDNGTEYVNKQMEELFKSNGIVHQRSVPYTPQQNGVAERYNRTIVERMRCMLMDAKLSESFWAEAANTAVYLINSIPKGKYTKSANELWNGEIIDFKQLRTFGETAMIHVPKEKRKKLDEKSEEGLFLGYEPNGYRLYNKETGKVIIAKDVVFLNPSTGKCLAVKEVSHSATIPHTYEDAMTGPHAEKWKAAMKDEYNSLLENNTWILTELPDDKKPIKSKWVFAVKEDTNGNVIKYKARLVAKGFSQIEGIDYQETFAPVVRYSSIRMLLGIAAHFNLRIAQMDAVTAFLNGKLDEEIYMEQPLHFDDQSGRYCKLIKSIYGLKQASRVWNETLNATLTNFGLIRSEVDQCIYHKNENNNILIIAIYVDDILIFSNSEELEEKVKNALKCDFKMKDIGEASSILGVRITRDKTRNTISLDQTAYINRILSKFNMQNCKPVKSPLENGQKISKELCPKEEEIQLAMKKIPYRQAIGSLLFLAMISRPDISFAVNLLSRYCENPGPSHWGAVKRLMRYIKGTCDYKLTYGTSNENLKGFSDADWASDLDERKSTTGYIFTIFGGAISWSSKRQATVALSSTEAEFMATVATIQEAIWLKNLYSELFNETRTTTIFCDNKGAIQVLNNNSYSSRTKHIDIKIKFIREHLQNKNIQLDYLSTMNMPADILTKNVFGSKIIGHLPNIGVEF